MAIRQSGGLQPERRNSSITMPILTGLLDRLTAAQLEPRTLIIVVSDHGNRSKSSDAENYRIPLLVTGHGVRPLVDNTFRSHIDLEGVIAHYLVDTALPPNQERVFVVGSTERWVYGEIHETGDHLSVLIPNKALRPIADVLNNEIK